MPFFFFLVMAFWSSVLGGAFYFVRRYVRAIERRSDQEGALTELRTRLLAVEELSETLRSEVARLESTQEFTTRLLERGASAASPPRP
ncbi:MAG: hypothetical protein H0W68_03140 [Gemmatimonadaceae bacterium]|nr:hypothetical protein [Gemmatimonadaceae bacterium]